MQFSASVALIFPFPNLHLFEHRLHFLVAHPEILPRRLHAPMAEQLLHKVDVAANLVGPLSE